MKVVIFGTGALYQRNKEKFKSMNIVAFLDNSAEKQGKYLDGVEVLPPDNVKELIYDYVLLVSKQYADMRKQLIALGIQKEKIIDREHRGDFSEVRFVKKYEKPQMTPLKKKILLVSHDMSLTGAPIVLLNMADILNKKGYCVEVYASKEGELVYSFLKKGISVSIFDEFNFNDKEVNYYFGKFELIIVNTVTLYRLVAELQKLPTHIVWWLHEEDNYYEQYAIQSEELVMQENVSIYGVGNRAIQSYRKYSHGREIEELLYGIEKSEEKNANKRYSQKLIFAIIGTVEKRKAQDIFFESIKRNWQEWREEAEFWIIGKIDDELKQEYNRLGMVKIWGTLEHEDLMELYDAIDVIVCPSRNDPMPVVLSEGMMNKKVCIASDMTGTAEYIEQYKNGLICKAGDVKSLSECINWLISNREQMKNIGENAFLTYEKRFSMEQFERNVLKIVEEKRSQV